jgi:predicted Rossmann-fold nucleotide-binding protein
MPIILVHEPFWRGFLDWMRERMVAEKLIKPEDLDLIQVIDDPAAIVDTIFKHYEKRNFVPSHAERETFLNL